MSEEAYVRRVPRSSSIHNVVAVRQITPTNWLINTPGGDQIAVNAKFDPDKNIWWCYMPGNKEAVATWNLQ